MPEVQFDITTTTGQFNTQVKRASDVALQFDRNLNKLKNTEQALNALGIKTASQINQEIKVRRDLIRVLGSEQPHAVATLTAQVEQLEQAQLGAASATRQADQALFNVGFILDDARQFSVSTAAGFRAISNNIQPLIQQVSLVEGGFKSIVKAMAGPAGLIIAVNSALALFALLQASMAKTEGAAKDLGASFSSAFKLPTLKQFVFDATLIEDRLEAIKAKLEGPQGLRRLSGASLTADQLAFVNETIKALEDEAEGLREARDQAELTAKINKTLAASFEEVSEGAGGGGDGDGGIKGTNTLLGDLRLEMTSLLSVQSQLAGANGVAIQQQRELNKQLEFTIALRELVLAGTFVATAQAAARTPGIPEAPDFELRENTGAAALEAEQKLQALRESRWERHNARLSGIVVGGGAQLIGDLAGALASGANVGDVLLKSLAQLAVRVGKMMIGFGVAGLGLKALIKNPVLAIAAGAALVALGSAARSAIGNAVDGGGGGGPRSGRGGGGSFAGAPFFDPYTGSITPGPQGALATSTSRTGSLAPILAGGGSGGFVVEVQGRIAGSDIELVRSRAMRRART